MFFFFKESEKICGITGVEKLNFGLDEEPGLVETLPKRPIRVLSLFDGIATGETSPDAYCTI